MREELYNAGIGYVDNYNQVVATEASNTTKISCSHIATSCNTSTETVHQVLTDFFSALIEINRKTKKEVRCSIGKLFGSLCINVNG